MQIFESLTKIPPIVLLVISALFIAAGDFSSKVWAINPTILGAFRCMIFFTLSSLLWLPALYQRNELALLGTIWSLLVAIATVLVGVLLFSETLEVRHWVGISFAMVALVLLSN